MRLWAAQVDYTRDVSIGPTSLSAAAENARKIRNAVKFILGNAYRGREPPALHQVQLGLVSRSPSNSPGLTPSDRSIDGFWTRLPS